MLSRKIIACVVLLLPATCLASLTLSAQQAEVPAIQEARPVARPVSPVPPTTQSFPSPFGNDTNLAQHFDLARSNMTTSWRNVNASPVQRIFASLKAAETDKDKAPLKTELRKALATEYNNKMDQYDDHIEKLEKELEQMRDRLSRRRAAKEEMVDLKLQEMLANADGLGWPSSPRRSVGLFTERFPQSPAVPSRVRETVPAQQELSPTGR